MSDWYSRAREEDGRTDDEILDDIRVVGKADGPDDMPLVGDPPYCEHGVGRNLLCDRGYKRPEGLE